MKESLEHELISLAPYMFNYEGAQDIQQSLISFGLCVNDGWYNLLKSLIQDLNKLDVDNTLKIVQVKEKFGGLRFYIDSGTDAIYKRIDQAEEQSYITCEYCGNDGKLQRGRWVITLCNECNEKRKNV